MVTVLPVEEERVVVVVADIAEREPEAEVVVRDETPEDAAADLDDVEVVAAERLPVAEA